MGKACILCSCNNSIYREFEQLVLRVIYNNGQFFNHVRIIDTRKTRHSNKTLEEMGRPMVDTIQ